VQEVAAAASLLFVLLELFTWRSGPAPAGALAPRRPRCRTSQARVSAASVGPGHRCDFRGQASRSHEASPERSGAVRLLPSVPPTMPSGVWICWCWM